MIYLCFGMQKSGSTLAYELTRGLLSVMGHPQHRLPCPLIKDNRRVNFISRSDMASFDEAALVMIEAAAPPPWVVAFKTHGPPSPFIRELAADGRVMGQANFRDPRDAVPSMLDAGQVAIRRGRGSFQGIDGWDSALENYEKHLESFEQWAVLPGVLVTHYEEVAFRSEAFLQRVARQLGQQDPDTLGLPGIVDCVKSMAFTQYNKGVSRRHRNDLSINESLVLAQRFGRQIETYMGEDLDALDRAFLRAAHEVPTPQLIAQAPAADIEAAPAPEATDAPTADRPHRAPPVRTVATEAFFRHHLLVHTHLEKTAGTTLVRALQALFGREHVHDLRGRAVPRPDALDAAQRERIRVLSGHFHMGAWERRFDRRAVYLACVRDPYERFRSYHAYVAKRPGHPAYPLIGQRPVAEAVDICLSRRHGAATNYLARYFGGRRPWLRFQRVRRNLENRYLAVVPHDSVHRLVARIAEAFGLEPPPETVFNAQAEYPSDDGAKALFMARNALDYRVFEYVNDRYEHWLERLPQRVGQLSRGHGA